MQEENYQTAERISRGHAYEKHVLERVEFPGIETREQFRNHVKNVLDCPTEVKELSGDRRAYWHEPSGTIVIRNPKRADGGTAFRPLGGRAYFDHLR